MWKSGELGVGVELGQGNMESKLHTLHISHPCEVAAGAAEAGGQLCDGVLVSPHVAMIGQAEPQSATSQAALMRETAQPRKRRSVARRHLCEGRTTACGSGRPFAFVARPSAPQSRLDCGAGVWHDQPRKGASPTAPWPHPGCRAPKPEGGKMSALDDGICRAGVLAFVGLASHTCGAPECKFAGVIPRREGANRATWITSNPPLPLCLGDLWPHLDWPGSGPHGEACDALDPGTAQEMAEHRLHRKNARNSGFGVGGGVRK